MSKQTMKTFFTASHGTLYQGDSLSVLLTLPAESVQCVGLEAYRREPADADGIAHTQVEKDNETL